MILICKNNKKIIKLVVWHFIPSGGFLQYQERQNLLLEISFFMSTQLYYYIPYKSFQISSKSMMQSQYSVSVDVWKMAVTCMSYVALAFTAWIFLRLLNACFWLPTFLSKYQNQAFQQSFGQETPVEDPKIKWNRIYKFYLVFIPCHCNKEKLTTFSDTYKMAVKL